MREPVSKKLRFQVLRRDRFACRYCGAKAGDAKLHIDHRVPVKHGGKTVIENLYAACQPCNLGKGTMAVDDVPIPIVVLMEIKFLEGMAVALGHSSIDFCWGEWIRDYYERGFDLSSLKEKLLEDRADNEMDLAHAYRGYESNMNRPSYMRLAKEWVEDPFWREGMSQEKIAYIREWRPD